MNSDLLPPLVLRLFPNLLKALCLKVPVGVVAKPVFDVAPSISGTIGVGETLTGSIGTITGATGTPTRAWLRDGAAIPGAANPTYVQQAADEGKYISFEVTASNVIGSTKAISEAVGPVTAGSGVPTLALGADVTQAEGNSGTTNFTFTVTRTGDLSAASSVEWAVTGAANAADFVGGVLPSGTVNFAIGSASQDIVVPVAGDVTVEGDETFTVTLSAPTNATIGDATAGGTITNDDVAEGGGTFPATVNPLLVPFTLEIGPDDMEVYPPPLVLDNMDDVMTGDVLWIISTTDNARTTDRLEFKHAVTDADLEMPEPRSWTFPGLSEIVTGTRRYWPVVQRGSERSDYGARVLHGPDDVPAELTLPTTTAITPSGATVGITTNTGEGQIWLVLSDANVRPSVPQMKAGQKHTGAAATDADTINPVTSAGVKTIAVSGLPTTTYYPFWYQEDALGNGAFYDSPSFTTATPVAAVLSSPTDAAVGTTGATLGVTVDAGNAVAGNLYYAVTTSATPPSKGQLKLGQNHLGAAADFAVTQAITTAGAKTTGAMGLLASTSYFSYMMHENEFGQQSNVAAADGFTTAAPSLPALTPAFNPTPYNGAAINTVTFTDLDFGAAAADRMIVVCVSHNQNALATTVTIGGVTAGLRRSELSSQIYSAIVPTGTTGSVVISTTSSLQKVTIMGFRGVGLNPVPASTASFAFGSGDPRSFTPTIGTNAFALAFIAVEGATRVINTTAGTEAYERQNADALRTFAAAYRSTAGNITFSGHVGQNSAVMAVFAP